MEIATLTGQTATPVNGTTVVCMSIAVALIILVLVVLIFSRQISYWLRALMSGIRSALSAGDSRQDYLLDDDDLEHLQGVPNASAIGTANSSATALPPGETSDTLMALGYTSEVPWDEVIQATELDPYTFVNHQSFVADVRRFSSGANFSSVADDNTSTDFVNFVGLRRPQHVPIGASSRQTPDIDETVLQRNKDFRW
jgi:hypothetical protein